MQRTLMMDVDDRVACTAQLPAGYELRPLCHDDAFELASVYLVSYARQIVPDVAAAREEMELMFAGEYGALDAALSPVVVMGCEMVGAGMTTARTPWPDTPAGPFVIEVFIHPQHRRLGLACAALEWVLAGAQRQGAATMALGVAHENVGAMALYSQLGFRERTP